MPPVNPLKNARPNLPGVARGPAGVEPVRHFLGSRVKQSFPLDFLIDGPAQARRARAQKELAAQDQGEGETDFRRDQSKLAEAVRSGQLPAGKSPAYLRGVHLGFLENLGSQYGRDLSEAYRAHPVSGALSTDGFNEFQQEFDEGWYGENMPDLDGALIADGFSPRADAASRALSTKFINDVSANVETRAYETIAASVGSAVDHLYALTGGIEDESEARLVAQLASNIISDANPDSLTANGLDKRKANDVLVAAFLQKARETGDASLLDALRHVETPGGSVMDIPRYRDQVLDVTSELQAREERADRFDDWKRTKDRETVHRDASNRAYLAFESGNTEEYEAALGQFRENGLAEDAFEMERLLERTVRESQKVVEDPAVQRQLWAELQDNPEASTVDILAGYEGQISASTTRAAFSYHQAQFEKRDITQSPRVRQTLSEIEDVVKGNELDFATDAAVNYARARSYFYDELDDWMGANPDARSIPRAVLEEIREKIFSSPGLQVDPPPNVFPGVGQLPGPIAVQPATDPAGAGPVVPPVAPSGPVAPATVPETQALPVPPGMLERAQQNLPPADFSSLGGIGINPGATRAVVDQMEQNLPAPTPDEPTWLETIRQNLQGLRQGIESYLGPPEVGINWPAQAPPVESAPQGSVIPQVDPVEPTSGFAVDAEGRFRGPEMVVTPDAPAGVVDGLSTEQPVAPSVPPSGPVSPDVDRLIESLDGWYDDSGAELGDPDELFEHMKGLLETSDPSLVGDEPKLADINGDLTNLRDILMYTFGLMSKAQRSYLNNNADSLRRLLGVDVEEMEALRERATGDGLGRIRLDEGFRPAPYLDTEGELTVGYGRNLDAHPLTDEEVAYLGRDDLAVQPLTPAEGEWLLGKDVAVAEDDISRIFNRMGEAPGLTQRRVDALVNMAYNLGNTRLLEFEKMWDAYRRDDWDTVADEALSSVWASQVKGRAVRIANALREG